MKPALGQRTASAVATEPHGEKLFVEKTACCKFRLREETCWRLLVNYSCSSGFRHGSEAAALESFLANPEALFPQCSVRRRREGWVTLVQHKSRNLRIDVPFAVVEVADPDIADARAVSDRQLFILGKKIGATNVLLYDTKRQLIGVVDVEVKLDTRSLGSKIREGSGGKSIRVNDVYGKLVLSGNGG